MARILQINANTISGIKIVNHLSDGTLENNEIYVNDIVTDLGYVVKDTLKKVSGRVDFIGTYYSDKGTPRVGHISVDHSKENEASITTIEPKTLIEYNTTKECINVTIEPVFKVSLKVVLTDESESEITFVKGMTIENLVIVSDFNQEEVKGSFVLLDWIYSPERGSMASSLVSVIGLKLADVEDETKIIHIGLRQIKVCGTVKEDDNETEGEDEKDSESLPSEEQEGESTSDSGIN